MGVISDLLGNVELPQMVTVRQRFDSGHIPEEEISNVIFEQLGRPEIADNIKPGMEIAITVGSRGIANIPLVIKSIADFVKSRGAAPLQSQPWGATGEPRRRGSAG